MTRSKPTGRTHRASRLIRTSPERLFQAFVTPDAITAWRPPAGMRMRLHAFDPRPGGEFRMALEYEGDHRLPGKSSANTDLVRGRFAELVPNRRIVEQVEFDSENPAFAGTMTVTTTLRPAEGGTEVTISCDDVPDGIAESDHVAGIKSSLEKLARFTE